MTVVKFRHQVSCSNAIAYGNILDEMRVQEIGVTMLLQKKQMDGERKSNNG